MGWRDFFLNGILSKAIMKYFLTPWNAKPVKHLILMENRTPTRTTRHRGYGSGVTFSSRCYHWNQNFSAGIRLLLYSGPDISHC